jgi:hypothetical protein
MKTDRDAIKAALFLAIEWERSMLGALSEQYEEQRKQADQCRANIMAFERVLDRRYAGARFRQPYGGTPISIQEMLRRPSQKFDPDSA